MISPKVEIYDYGYTSNRNFRLHVNIAAIYYILLYVQLIHAVLCYMILFSDLHKEKNIKIGVSFIFHSY